LEVVVVFGVDISGEDNKIGVFWWVWWCRLMMVVQIGGGGGGGAAAVSYFFLFCSKVIADEISSAIGLLITTVRNYSRGNSSAILITNYHGNKLKPRNFLGFSLFHVIR
jgi:hypothetical protein